MQDVNTGRPGGMPTDTTRIEARLRAAHDRLERECVRSISGTIPQTLSISVSGSTLVYSYGGEIHPITWFDLLTYGEALKTRRVIRSFDAAYPCISFALDDTARAAFLAHLSARPTEVEETSDPSKEGDHPLPESVGPMNEAPAIEPARPGQDGSLPPLSDIMMAILVALREGPLRRNELLERAGDVLGYPLARAHAGEVPTDGVSVHRTMDRMFSLLVYQYRLVLREGKTFELTAEARAKLVANVELDLQCHPVMKPKKDKKSRATGLQRLGHEGLVTMWGNAVRILANPQKKRMHDQARSVIDKITREWELRARSETGYFKWPSTEARGGNGRLTMFDAEKEGMLSFLEYRVGRVKGEPQAVRRMILVRVFEGSLPPVFNKDYMSQWGANGSPERLHKMAVSIAAFARNFKRRRSANYNDAIRDWEADLEFLRVTFYVGRFGFGWPVTAV